MKNEKLTVGRVSINNHEVHKGTVDIVNPNKDFHLVTKDDGQIRPTIIGRVPGMGRSVFLQSRLNWNERPVITIPIERNRDISNIVTISMDFNLPLGRVKISEEGDR